MPPNPKSSAAVPPKVQPKARETQYLARKSPTTERVELRGSLRSTSMAPTSCPRRDAGMLTLLAWRSYTVNLPVSN